MTDTAGQRHALIGLVWTTPQALRRSATKEGAGTGTGKDNEKEQRCLAYACVCRSKNILPPPHLKWEFNLINGRFATFDLPFIVGIIYVTKKGDGIFRFYTPSHRSLYYV